MGLVVDSFDRANTTQAAGLGFTDTGEAWEHRSSSGLRILANVARSAVTGTQEDVVDTGGHVGTIEARFSNLAGVGSQGSISLLAHYSGFFTTAFISLATFIFSNYAEVHVRNSTSHEIPIAGAMPAGFTNGTVLAGLRVGGRNGAWELDVLADGLVVASGVSSLLLPKSELWGIGSTAQTTGQIDDLTIDTHPFGGRRSLRTRQRRQEQRPLRAQQFSPLRGRSRESM